MKKALSILLAVLLVSSAGFSCAETKHVRPLELTPDSYDLNNGEFWFEANDEKGKTIGSFAMALYLEERYSIEEVDALKPGDTIEIGGETYLVEAVVIHGWYDSDGDGELDTGDITVREPELAQYLLEKYETVVSDAELVPSAYEIYTNEAFDGYLSLTIGEDGYCHPLVNDETFRKQVGMAEVTLPLPDGFVFHYQEDWNDREGGEKEFLGTLADVGFDPWRSMVRFQDGKMAEAWDFD